MIILRIACRTGMNMKADDSVARAVRLARIPHFLQGNPQGLTTRELAGLCNVCRRTIQRDLMTLQLDLKLPITQKGDRYSLLGDYLLPPVSFSLYEAVAMFLASRLVVRGMDESNPHMDQAFRKIAAVLPHPLEVKVEEGVVSIVRKRGKPGFIRIYEKIAEAWTAQRQLIIHYQSLQSSEIKQWMLEPYYMEMTGVGYSCYVIGHARRDGKEGIFTFKLDRIRKARVTGRNFQVPAEVDIGKLLSTSWGVIWGDEIQVVLKFSPKVIRRVKESSWHPSQVISNLPDGGCLLKLKIGSLMEITPWIRGWGPDVEVITPLELRKDFKAWAEQLNNMYSGGN